LDARNTAWTPLFGANPSICSYTDMRRSSSVPPLRVVPQGAFRNTARYPLVGCQTRILDRIQFVGFDVHKGLFSANWCCAISTGSLMPTTTGKRSRPGPSGIPDDLLATRFGLHCNTTILHIGGGMAQWQPTASVVCSPVIPYLGFVSVSSRVSSFDWGRPYPSRRSRITNARFPAAVSL